MLQLNRYVDGDAWVIEQMLDVLAACAQTAAGCGAADREDSARIVARTIAHQGREQVKNDRDRAALDARIAAI